MNKAGICFLFILGLLPSTVNALSDTEKEAKWLLERLTGTRWPADDNLVLEMSQLITTQSRSAAAQRAMREPEFYNITIKQFALLMSTREETIRTPFNDFAASFIGVTRDDIDARQLLTGNFYYAAAASRIPAGVTIPMDIGDDMLASNKHYESLESQRLNLVNLLEKRDFQLLSINDANDTVLNPDAAGVLTSRAFLEAHATAGTNRRLVEFSFRQFLCSPIDSIADTMAPDVRIGRDIDRFPGGDPVKFQTTCKGCHTVMDGFRGAFAKWDFLNGTPIHSAAGGTQGRAPRADSRGIASKLNQNNNVYSGGYVTTDDSWINFANRGTNATNLMWRSNPTGNGVRGFGEQLANSQRFSQCMARRTFEMICKRTLPLEEQMLIYAQVGAQWETTGYKLKKLFEVIATHPKCRHPAGGSL